MPLEESVIELLRLANYSVKTVSMRPKYEGCSLEAIKSTSTGMMSRTITCLGDSGQFAPFLKFADAPKESWIVVSDEDPPSISQGLQGIVRKRRLTVLTLTLFYDQMLRAREICTKTLGSTARWKEETIDLERLAGLYVPQLARASSNSHEDKANDSNQLVTSLLTGSGGKVIFILADAGRGKTWLTWSFAHDAAKRYLESTAEAGFPKGPLPPIPFLIPFSQYKRLTSFDGIVLERLNSFGTLDIRAEGFNHLLSKGRIVLILDGFDEMLELAPAHARENLREIQRHLEGQSKLILTSRRSVFPTRKEIAEFIQLSDPRPEGVSLTVCYLDGFSREQLKAFHRARGATETEIKAIINLPFDKELHGSPQIAEYFLDIVRAGLSLNQEKLFPTILSLIYQRESDKWVREANQKMPPELQEKFLTEVSLVMWPEGFASPELIQLFADELGHPYLSKHHLLQPTLDGQLQFEHHVWRDWFMARALLERLSGAGWAPRALSSNLANPLPEYCIKFLGMQIDEDMLGKALRDPAASDSAFSNLVRVFLSRHADSAVPSARAKNLAEVLGSQDAFKHRRLEKVRFEVIDFQKWGFDGATFDEVIFSFCTLPRAYEKALRGRGTNIIECTWFPTESLGGEAIARAQESVRSVLKRFVTSTDPVRVRDEVAKEKMSRDYHIDQGDPALRCLMKFGYIKIGLEAKSQEFYQLNKHKLDEIVCFMRDSRGLEGIINCIAE